MNPLNDFLLSLIQPDSIFHHAASRSNRMEGRFRKVHVNISKQNAERLANLGMSHHVRMRETYI